MAYNDQDIVIKIVQNIKEYQSAQHTLLRIAAEERYHCNHFLHYFIPADERQDHCRNPSGDC